eukprot:53806-Pelagomonas_calceolata.AAC.5
MLRIKGASKCAHCGSICPIPCIYAIYFIFSQLESGNIGHTVAGWPTLVRHRWPVLKSWAVTAVVCMGMA